MEYYEINELAKKLGADVFGVADLDLLREYETYPANLLDGFNFGISIGVKVPDPLFDSLPASRPLYSRYYVVANDMLDRIAFELSRAIEREATSFAHSSFQGSCQFALEELHLPQSNSKGRWCWMDWKEPVAGNTSVWAKGQACEHSYRYAPQSWKAIKKQVRNLQGVH